MSLIKKLISNRNSIILIIVSFFLGFYFKNNVSFLTSSTISPTPTKSIDITAIAEEVIPTKGYETSVSWNDIGQKLISTGAIDIDKYRELFKDSKEELKEFEIFNSSIDKKITISDKNARFIVNTLWALGLTNKSIVLDEGPMRTSDNNTANFASTGGWTLGSKEPMKLYSSANIIPLTSDEQQLVQRIAENVYRPCCGNHTAFPDCNHGMAALAYIELAVFQHIPEQQIYKDILALNSFWFQSTYVDMAVYFKKNQNLSWSQVDPKLALSRDYSSAVGAQRISQEVQNVSKNASKGSGCSA